MIQCRLTILKAIRFTAYQEIPYLCNGRIIDGYPSRDIYNPEKCNIFSTEPKETHIFDSKVDAKNFAIDKYVKMPEKEKFETVFQFDAVEFNEKTKEYERASDNVFLEDYWLKMVQMI